MHDILQHLADHWGDWLGGAVVWSALTHAIRTIPMPQNPWGAWIVNTFQFVFANIDKMRGNTEQTLPRPDPPRDDP